MLLGLVVLFVQMEHSSGEKMGEIFKKKIEETVKSKPQMDMIKWIEVGKNHQLTLPVFCICKTKCGGFGEANLKPQVFQVSVPFFIVRSIISSAWHGIINL